MCCGCGRRCWRRLRCWQEIWRIADRGQPDLLRQISRSPQFDMEEAMEEAMEKAMDELMEERTEELEEHMAME